MEENLRNNLIDKLQNNTISSEEREELFKLYNSYQFSKEWDENTMGNFEDVRKKILKGVKLKRNGASKGEIYAINSFLRIAAACLLVFFTGWLGYTLILKPDPNVIVESGKSRKEVVLPDGSKITMNINSTLTYPRVFEAKRREVKFEGEGFFEIQADRSHPFIVATPHVKVRVLGTAFNLKAYKEDPAIETSLIHGKVEVLTAKEERTLSILTPNHKFVVDKIALITSHLPQTKSQIEVVPMEFIDPSNTAPVDLAWKEGKFAFASSPFQDIAREMKRRYAVDIIFENKEAADFKYTASFEQEDVVDILDALQLVKPFKYRKEGNKIVVY